MGEGGGGLDTYGEVGKGEQAGQGLRKLGIQNRPKYMFTFNFKIFCVYFFESQFRYSTI